MKVSDLSVIVPKFRIKRRYIEFTQLHEYVVFLFTFFST